MKFNLLHSCYSYGLYVVTHTWHRLRPDDFHIGHLNTDARIIFGTYTLYQILKSEEVGLELRKFNCTSNTGITLSVLVGY